MPASERVRPNVPNVHDWRLERLRAEIAALRSDVDALRAQRGFTRPRLTLIRGGRA